MNILIIGAKGMLGSELVRVLGAEYDITPWDLEEIDITDRISTINKITKKASPELIINSAAYVNVDACEDNPDTAWRINALGSQNLALAAQIAGCAYLYFSSDYIFAGKQEGFYDELASPGPVNQYGRSKLAGEVLARQVCPRTYIIRTAWLFGHRPNNYVDRVLSMADREGVVRMPEDQIESPTYTTHLAEAVRRLIATGAYGTYNITSQGACTRPEFARFVLKSAGRSEPVESVDPSRLNRNALRPGRTVLDCRLYRLVTGHILGPWQEGVEEYLSR